MRPHTPSTFLHLSGLTLLTVASMSFFNQTVLRWSYPAVEASASPPARRISIGNPQSAIADRQQVGRRVASVREHCPPGCHAGVQSAYVHVH
jgi:hypothetical protein